MTVLVLDNTDSFVWNLARSVEELGRRSIVVRSDEIDIVGVRSIAPTHIILSPGPFGPERAGVCPEVLAPGGWQGPVLGVCLGHQCIGVACGARLVRSAPVHGHPWPVHHDGTGLFDGLPSPFQATRYHSLLIDHVGFPDDLVPLAWSCVDPRAIPGSDDRLLMAMAHRRRPLLGLQFHPESIATEHGDELLSRFLAAGDRWWATGQWIFGDAADGSPSARHSSEASPAPITTAR